MPFVVPDPACGTQECAAQLHQLAEAVHHRDAIGMAKGLIMATTDCGPDEAFERLRSESRHTNRKLRHVAEQVVSDHLRRSVATSS